MTRDRRVYGRVQLATRLGKLAQIVVERAGEHVAAFSQLGDVAGDRVVDRHAVLGQRLQVGLEGTA